MSFVACSPRHHHCSPSHSRLVSDYRLERERQIVALESVTGGYVGDYRFWREQGGRLIDFRDWLKWNKKDSISEK